MESDPTHPEVEITGSRKRKMPNKFQKGRKSHCVEQETLPASPSSTSSGIPPPPCPAPLEKISSHNICLTKLDGTAIDPCELAGPPPPPPPPPPPFTKISSHNTRLTKLDGPPPPPPLGVKRPMHQIPEPVLRDLPGLSKEKWVKVHGWNLISKNGLSKLEKSWMVASIPNLLKMLKIVGHVKEDRHLEIEIAGWDFVTIGIWTPGVGGLTKNDFILAAKINAIDMEHLMRQKCRVNGGSFWVDPTHSEFDITDLFEMEPVPQPMTEESARELIPKVDGWNLMTENGSLKLKRSWKLASFPKLLEMFKLIAFSRGDRPKVHVVGFYDVTIVIWTAVAGGLTENDFTLAAKINAIDMNHLMN